MLLRKFAAIALAAAAMATSAQALTLAPAKYRGGLSGGYSYNSLTPNSISHTSPFGTKTASSTTIGGLKASVIGVSTIAGDGVAEASINYKFAVLSAFPGVIHILINGSAESAGSGNYFGESGVDLFGSTNATVAYAHSCHASPGCAGNQVFASGGPKPVLIHANEAYTINIYASGGTFDANSSFNVWADPTITFDPAYDHPADAVFAFSEGVPGPVVAVDGGVPEPASWAMMIMGFGSIGVLMRRRERGVAA